MSDIKSVESFLKGLTSVNNNLIFIEDSKLITRLDNNRSDSKVKLICGGGSGHEPAHAGYVGRGMLTTAVCGEIFASPTSTNILNGILLTGDNTSNIIVIITNYTGDRIQFGVAIEAAKTKYNYKNIHSIFINEDVSIQEEHINPAVGKRGLAGTVLIHKLLGAMAELNKSFDEICQFGDYILANELLCTVGVSFHTCSEKINDIEIGKGIHGEPGVLKLDSKNDFNEIVEIILNKFSLKLNKGTKVILLINNLGGTSEFIMNLFAGVLLEKFNSIYSIKKIYCGTFLSSLKAEGLSVTLLKIDDFVSEVKIVEYLEFETNVACNAFGCNKKDRNELNQKSQIRQKSGYEEEGSTENKNVGVSLSKEHEELFKLCVTAACRCLSENFELLNECDSEFGDGDTGSTLKKGTDALLHLIENNVLNSFKYPMSVIQHISDVFQKSVGGSSGALISLFFQSLSSVLVDDYSLQTWCSGVQKGVETMMKYGLAKVGDRTMIDPLSFGVERLQKFDDSSEIIDALKDFTDGVKESTEKSKLVIPKAGRAAYTFSENQNQTCVYPDPGSKAIELVVDSIYNVFVLHFK